VQRKLELLAGYVAELEPLVAGGRPPAGNLERRALERLVQLVVEVAIDVNGLLAAECSLPPPRTSRESFEVLVGTGVLSPAVAEPFIASYVSLRNRLVHDYDRVDPRPLARSAARLVGDSRAYARVVLAHMRLASGSSDVREPRVRYRKTSAKPVRSGPVRKRTT
jgi:uncharacterized protein YutE (UPF0331/DUF86 family)